MIRSSNKGFTIVELLIVIVIIAILATISYVGYSGIQARAMLTQQTAELDRIGEAIKLWSAENGKTLAQSGSGHSGRGVGSFTRTGGDYTPTSVEDILRDSGYLTGSFLAFDVDTVMVSPCMNNNDPRWLVFAIVDPVPSKSTINQIADTGCTSTYASLYTNSTYGRNILRAY